MDSNLTTRNDQFQVNNTGINQNDIDLGELDHFDTVAKKGKPKIINFFKCSCRSDVLYKQ